MTNPYNFRYTSHLTIERRRELAKMPKWSEQEIDFLLENCEKTFVNSLHEKYNAWAEQNGFPNRSVNAILTRLTRYGKSRYPINNPDEYSDAVLARLLYVTSNCLRDFRIKNIPDIRRYGKTAIWSKREIEILCEWRPQIFCGRKYEALLQLLRDDKRAKFFASMPWCEIKDAPIRHIEKDIVYCSIKDASRILDIAHHIIQDQCGGRNVFSCKHPGYTFEFVFPAYKILHSRTSNPSGKQVYRKRSPD